MMQLSPLLGPSTSFSLKSIFRTMLALASF